MDEPQFHESDEDGAGAALLRDFLRHHDAPCPVCGYSLHNLTGDVCPECGQRFKLQVGGVNPHFGYLLAFLAPMIMVVGLAVTLTILVVIALVILGPPTSGARAIYAIQALGVVDAVGVIAVYRRRKWFLTRTKRTQTMLVVTAWVINVLYVFASMVWGT